MRGKQASCGRSVLWCFPRLRVGAVEFMKMERRPRRRLGSHGCERGRVVDWRWSQLEFLGHDEVRKFGT